MFTQTDLQGLTNIDSFLSLSDRDFEWCCKFLLEKASYGKAFVTKKGPKGGDGGIDLDVYSTDRKLVACGQCKLWKGRYNGLMKPVRELCGSMKIRGVSRGFFIVTVEATPEEKREAQLMNIEMIDASALLELVKRCTTRDVIHSTPVTAVISLSSGHEQKEKNDTTQRIARFVFAIIGFLLMVVGYVFAGAFVLLLIVLSFGFNEAGNNDRPRKKYRRRHKRHYGYGF